MGQDGSGAEVAASWADTARSWGDVARPAGRCGGKKTRADWRERTRARGQVRTRVEEASEVAHLPRVPAQTCGRGAPGPAAECGTGAPEKANVEATSLVPAQMWEG